MYHLKLVKSRSYTGIIKATQENPNVFVKDKATADAAVASGYFTLVGEVAQEGGSEIIKGHLDKAQLDKMKKDDLKKLADDLGIDSSGFKRNSDYVDAIVAAGVTTDDGAVLEPEGETDAIVAAGVTTDDGAVLEPEGETGDGDNEVDFGEGE